MDADRSAAAEVVTALLDHDVPVVALGGAAAPPKVSGADRVVLVPDRVVDAATAVAEAIDRRR
jgi:hypothetical protein